jgi:hypothetical protein
VSRPTQSSRSRRWTAASTSRPLTARSNRIIGGDVPSRYLGSLRDNHGVILAEEDANLPSHLVDPSTCVPTTSKGSFEARRRALLDRITEGMGKALVPDPTEPDDPDSTRRALTIRELTRVHLGAAAVDIARLRYVDAMAERRYWTNSFDVNTWPQRNPNRQHWRREAHRPLTALEPGDLVFGYVTKVGWAVVYECISGVKNDPHESQWGEEYPLIADVRELLLLGVDGALHTRDLPPNPLLRQDGGMGPFIPSLIQKTGRDLGPERGGALLAALIDRWHERNPGQSLDAVGVSPFDRSAAGAGRQVDVEVRRALEHHAMTVVAAHFDALGYDVEDVSRQASYDLRATRGTDAVRVEVKGQLGPRDIGRADAQRGRGRLGLRPELPCRRRPDRMGTAP